MSKPVTRKRKQVLAWQMRQSGIPVAMIAERMGLTLESAQAAIWAGRKVASAVDSDPQSAAPKIKDRIMAAHRANPDWTTRQIADHVGCRIEYVRVVVRQRKGSGTSDIDRKYEESTLGRATKSKNSKSKAPARLAYYNALYRSGDYAQARAAYRETMRQLRGERMEAAE